MTEDDDLVETVEEFGAEVLLELLVYKRTDPVVVGFIRIPPAEFKAKATAALFDHLRTDVRGHDDQGVLEVDRAALGIGQATVFEQLQQQVEHIGMGFLDLIEEHHGVGATPHRFGELATFVEAHISGRRADQLADRVALHEFGHVEADH